MSAGNDLGAALRRWRDRAIPSPGGVDTSRRRAPGMRRGELGAAAGVSAEYIKRLEQGHGRPSAAVLYALARALRLSQPEYEYFCSLASHMPVRSGRVPHKVGPGTRRLLERLGDVPICVMDAAWTLLAWNTAWEKLCSTSVLADGRERNMAWRVFTGDPVRTRPASEREARFQSSIATDLRSTALRYPDDDWLTDLVTDLRAASPAFDVQWQTHGDNRFRDHQVRVPHPDVGDITVDCDILTIHEGDLRAVVYTAEPGSVDGVRLALIKSQGSDRA